MTKLQEKLYYTIAGCTMSLLNVALIDTRFNLVGMGFGLSAVYLLIRAILIKADK